ncbi:MAG: quinol:cytochrome C oxidoreductase [bacterium]|nr:quinol:cytochrome C oxidoreductase [bacterium]
MRIRDDKDESYRFQGPGAGALARGAFAAALACLAVAAASLFGEVGRARFAFAWLAAWTYYLSLVLGVFFFVMLHHLSGARWSVVLRRLAEGIMMLLPALMVLFIPILFMLDDLYPWARPQVAVADPAIRHKILYLNPPFFMVRVFVYFAIWIVLARLLFQRSLRQDQTADPAMLDSMRRWSAPGMLLYSLTVTFAAIDWVMSLEPDWVSTIFGVYFFAGAFVGSLALLILAAFAMGSPAALGPAITAEHHHDLGKLLFAFLIFWAYIAFSQMMLIWMANLPDETFWYRQRWEPLPWRAVSWSLLIGQFIIPCAMLLPRWVKRNRLTLALVSIIVLAMHYVDIYWIIMPALNPARPPWHWLDFLLLAGMGFLLAGICLWRMRQYPLVPVGDPYLEESLSFENV